MISWFHSATTAAYFIQASLSGGNHSFKTSQLHHVQKCFVCFHGVFNNASQICHSTVSLGKHSMNLKSVTPAFLKPSPPFPYQKIAPSVWLHHHQNSQKGFSRSKNAWMAASWSTCWSSFTCSWLCLLCVTSTSCPPWRSSVSVSGWKAPLCPASADMSPSKTG